MTPEERAETLALCQARAICEECWHGNEVSDVPPWTHFVDGIGEFDCKAAAVWERLRGSAVSR